MIHSGWNTEFAKQTILLTTLSIVPRVIVDNKLNSELVWFHSFWIQEKSNYIILLFFCHDLVPLFQFLMSKKIISRWMKKEGREA